MWVAFFLAICSLVSSFQFDLAAKSYKCFTEELPPNFDVYGEYTVKDGAHQLVDFKVQHENGQVVVSLTDVNGKGDFNFIARIEGEYRFCFYNRLVGGVPFHYGLSRRVGLNLYTGTETYDYQNVARREHLKPVEINLRMMEDIVKQIYGEYQYFKAVEAHSHETNDSTHLRVLLTAVFSILFMIVFGVWQVIYLKNFFKERKVM